MTETKLENREADYKFTPQYSDPGSSDYSGQQFGRSEHLDYLVKPESDGSIEKLKEILNYGKTGLEVFYSTKEASEEKVEDIKLNAMYRLSDSAMRDTFRGFSMNFIAHKGMFPGSDIVFGAVGAYEGLISDIGRADIDFQERYRTLVDEHINSSSTGKDIELGEEVKFSEINRELEDD